MSCRWSIQQDQLRLEVLRPGLENALHAITGEASRQQRRPAAILPTGPGQVSPSTVEAMDKLQYRHNPG